MSSTVKLYIYSIILFFSATCGYASDITHRFEIQKVTDGIYTAHPVGPISKVNSTSTIIVGDTYLTVVEAQPDQALAEELINSIREKVSKLPIRYLVVTHFHLDHILGAAAFLKENPFIVILAHRNVTAYIRGNGEGDKKQWADFLKIRATQTQEEAAKEKNPERKLFLEGEAQVLSKYSEDVSNSPLMIPTQDFSDSLTIHDKSLTLELVYLGSGHTSSDITIRIPERKVLIAGDLVHGFEPLFGNANPDNWISILKKLKATDCEYFIGGHGDAYNKNILSHWLEYISELKTKTVEAIQKGMSLKDFQQSLTQESFSALASKSFGQGVQQHRMALMTDRFIGSLDEAIRGELESLWTFYGGVK